MLSARIAINLAFIVCVVTHDPIVEISSGKLVGSSVEFSHKDVDDTSTLHVFKGIPYAEPPVGDLRFRPPRPKSRWDGVYNATYYRSICVQPLHPFIPSEGTQNEDCLFLNVYAPKTTSKRLPVMVWIHGGGLYIGSGSDYYYDGTALAAIGDVIVVSFNYRLGALGFLVTGDDHATGNYGLYDQIAALQWVQENIEAFGGDRDKVTIFGESAGSVSVEYLILSPLINGLFQRAIMQSGTASMDGFRGKDSSFHGVIAKGLGKLVGCEGDNSDELFRCLRAVPAQDFRNSGDPALGLIANITGLGTKLRSIPFPPVMDANLIVDNPVDVIRKREFTKENIDIMIGTMADEASMFLLEIMADMANESEIFMNRTVFEDTHPLFVAGPGGNNPAALDAIKLMYVEWENADSDGADYIDAFIQMGTDQYFTCPADLSARAHSQAGSKVYRYQMTHTPSKSMWRIKWMRAAHVDEIPFVFGWHFLLGEEWTMPMEEVDMSLKMIQYWTNFAKTGNPNMDCDGDTISEEDKQEVWPVFTVPGLAYKELSLKMENKRALKARECAMWNDFIPKLLKHTETGIVCTTSGDETSKYTERGNF
ncbi:acetylcholinesterase-like [Ptychodera flava]|uniref:acetylcholinesterase-like n=1 Tax=Ptychodera flava TaxID=63121 RepID=UPI003969C67E